MKVKYKLGHEVYLGYGHYNEVVLNDKSTPLVCLGPTYHIIARKFNIFQKVTIHFQKYN